MNRRIVSGIVAVLALACGAVTLTTSAHAAAPLSFFIEYTGSGTTQGMGDASGPFAAEARVDCASGECLFSGTLHGDAYDWQLEQDQRLVLANGHGEFAMGEWGDICTEVFWTAPGTLTVDATATGITITRTGSGTPTGDCLGEASGTVTISYTARISGTVSGGDACVLDASCPAGVPLTTPGASGPADPGTLSTLPTVAQSSRPANLLWATALAVVLVLLVAFPAHLLNTAAEHGTDRFSAWWKRVRGTKRTMPAALERLNGWPLAIIGVVVASVVSAFVDPRFGQDPGGSLRIVGSILLAFALDVAVGWALLLLFLRRTMPDAKARLRFAPASLLLVLAAVVFSRVTGFQPGIVFGLVAGVAIGATLASAAKARVALIGLGYSFGIGVVAWIAYTVAAGAAGPDPSAGGVFVTETLSAIAIGGMAVLPVALFPLRGMTGYDIFSWNKVIWALAYGVGLFGFFFVLMPMPFAWQGVPFELGVWIGLYLIYAVAAVAIWAFITRPWDRKAAA